MFRVSNENLFVCFYCEGEPGFYFEFEERRSIENPPCPKCRKHSFTMPLYYLEQFTIPVFQELMSKYAEITPWIPFLDLNFKSFKIPGAIICSHKITG